MDVIKITGNTKKNALTSLDYDKIVVGVFGKKADYEVVDDGRRNFSTLTINYKKQEHFVFLSSSSPDARNVFISQPLLNTRKFVPNILAKSTRIYISVTTLVKNTARSNFDIRCSKTFGIKFIGLDEIGETKISSIKPFESLPDFYEEFNKLQSDSKSKKNDVTNIVETSESIEISDAKTEGATYGSMMMLVFGLINLSKKPIKIYLNTDNKFGPDGLKYFSGLGVECAFAEDEIVELFKKNNRPVYDIDTNKRTPALQRLFTEDLIKGLGYSHCQVTGQSYGVISSHILPCHMIERLANTERISKDLCKNLMTSRHNGLRLVNWLDSDFDKGRISYTDDGLILASEELLDNIKQIYLPSVVEKVSKIEMDEKCKVLMQFHRKYVYYKESIDDIDVEEISLLESVFNSL